ncbi:hypothetical protein [Oxynema aestuarii]|jgi:glycyl-tRNA synthetase beta subunit|uniref:Uncharacterized protein n=1 Tax=Oxynema aestuarii AP17 TaxID=2064643 RepID=A0A6H1U550_9CYAN|nr:hypothetical protein [Oxynema aestuarii]QIZ73497.1 hypothetical protein HCG48_25265 [Oxynema aestuarii AP17]RMH78422.1 MAG: hypothetical protein D6680_02245 [Cyanobacteria bacterium J007]
MKLAIFLTASLITSIATNFSLAESAREPLNLGKCDLARSVVAEYQKLQVSDNRPMMARQDRGDR